MTVSTQTLNLSPEQTKLVMDYSASKEFSQTVEKYDLRTVGIWKIASGDDGMSFRPHMFLGFFEGRLSDVMSHIVLLQPSFRGFHTWGSIELVEPVKTNIDIIQKTLNLRDEIAQKRQELAALEAKQG